LITSFVRLAKRIKRLLRINKRLIILITRLRILKRIVLL